MPSRSMTMLTDIVDRANKLFSDSDDATSIIAPCNRNIRPVYPVRYAYMNYFTTELLKPQLPPSVGTLLRAESHQETGGYAARVLREGWVYVKEEEPLIARGSQAPAGILIFRHILNETEDHNDITGVTEIFSEYVWDDSEQEYREKIQSCPPQGFLPVKKDIKKISLLFSDVPLSPVMLMKLNDDIALRQSVMQTIDLDSEDKYTLELSADNLSALVEDYKPADKQFSRYHEDVDLEDGYSCILSKATTQNGYVIDPVKKENTFRACYGEGEKGTLVILHDPVGRQKDIIEIYRFLVTYLKSFFYNYDYPITIGNYIEALLKNDSEEIRKTVSDSLNQTEWDRDWTGIKNIITGINARKADILSLYNSFAFNKKLTNAPCDGLKRHLGSLFVFFTAPADESGVQEIGYLADLLYDITNALQFTELGAAVLERFFCQELTSSETVKKLQDKELLKHYVQKYTLSEKYDLLPVVATMMLDTESGEKAFKAYSETLPTEKSSLTEDWKDILTPLHTFLNNKITERPDVKDSLIKALDKLFVVFGKGFAVSLLYMGTSGKDTFALKGRVLMADVAKKYAVLSGINIDIYNTDTVSGQELDDELKKMSGSRAADKPRPETAGMGTRLFDWDKLTARLKDDKWIKIPRIIKTADAFSRIGTADSPVNGQRVLSYIDKSLPGLSFCLNTLVIFSISNQSVHQRNNPLKSRYLTLYGLKMSEAFIAAFDNTRITVSGARQLRKLKLFSDSRIIKAVARLPKSPLLNQLGVMKSFRYLGLAGAVVSAGISGYEAHNSYRIGNDLNMTFKLITGAGYVMMALGIAGGLFMAGSTAISWPVLLFVGTITMLLGVTGDLATEWNDLETLIRCCFWGNSEKYPFWSEEKKPYIKRLESAQSDKDKYKDGFLIENQEFINLFYMPNLEWTYTNKVLTFKMELSNFIPYESQFFYQFCSTIKTKNKIVASQYKKRDDYFLYNRTSYIKKSYGELEFTLSDDIKEHYIYNADRQSTTLELTINTPKGFYFDNEIFIYYRPFDDTIAPLRYDWNGSSIASLNVTHYGKMVARSGGQSWS
ncbi:toxin VasX [Morganella morganii]|uniref:toxin VasX n=1 Tax=Morganella morganii TaxID=582 RepID=UPI0021CF50D0|nr:toxin VasX [Morganella morganii]MCU6226397.1 hypothetical protein [Morganella morganii]MCU6235296.1 hypothetical protein [Morganella morganii]